MLLSAMSDSVFLVSQAFSVRSAVFILILTFVLFINAVAVEGSSSYGAEVKVPDGNLQDIFTLRETFYHDSRNPHDEVKYIVHDFRGAENRQQAAGFLDESDNPAVIRLKSRRHDDPPRSPSRRQRLNHKKSLRQQDSRSPQLQQQQLVLNDDNDDHDYGPASEEDGGQIDPHLAGVTPPDVSDKQTVINLAKMTSDAYILNPGRPDWINLTDGFNHSSSFGWKRSELRGHVFANADNSTIVISFKGTSIDPRERTRVHDRENDNILFSCCCGSQRSDPYFWWRPVCNCRTGHYTCNATCLSEECRQRDRYYALAMDVVQRNLPKYPKTAQLWIAGHSLGGAIASFVAMKMNVPAVTFESPPQRLPAQRLGLLPHNTGHGSSDDSGQNFPYLYHFGNTADPIFMGQCNGFTSSCAWGGYAFESTCFSGKRCVYDTAADKGWHLNILNHRIDTVILTVLSQYPDVPQCFPHANCTDCPRWTYT